MTNCKVCAGEAKQKCSGCLAVFYCSRNCQVADWKSGHKSECKPFEVRALRCKFTSAYSHLDSFQVKRSDKLGRYMVAARDLKAGEVLFREFAVVHGPKMLSHPICLGCHKTLTPSTSKATFYRCSRCAWPLCSKACESLEPHVDECQLMSAKHYKCPIKGNCVNVHSEAIYCLIFPLRFLLLKLNQPKM
jgi:MYND finger